MRTKCIQKNTTFCPPLTLLKSPSVTNSNFFCKFTFIFKVSARDPIFYRWHKFIEDLVQSFRGEHKEKYAARHFEVANKVEAREISTILQHEENTLTNHLVTYMEDKTLDIREDVQVRYNRINHVKFQWKIDILNPENSSKKVMVRVFLAALRTPGDTKYVISTYGKVSVDSVVEGTRTTHIKIVLKGISIVAFFADLEKILPKFSKYFQIGSCF